MSPGVKKMFKMHYFQFSGHGFRFFSFPPLLLKLCAGKGFPSHNAGFEQEELLFFPLSLGLSPPTLNFPLLGSSPPPRRI